MDFALIAQQALAQYDIRTQAITAIAQSGGAVFKVEAEDGQVYNLRIHVPKSTTLEEIWTRRDVLDSEMVWLEALCHDTDLALPIPQRSRQGSYAIQVDGVPCTLLTWVPGEQKQYFFSEADLESTARMTATLHRQASAWQPPTSFTRPTHGGARIRLALDMLAQRVQEGQLDAQDIQVMTTAGEKGIALFDVLPKTPLTWGILHMDLLPANIVYVNGRATPIDFGACGYSFFLNHLASTFCFVHPSQRQRYIDWYAAGFPLPENPVEQLEAFFIAARLTTMIHFLGLPGAFDWLPGHIHKLAQREFGSYVIGRSFLFSGTPFWE